MIFRRYTSLIIIASVICLAAVLFGASPFLNGVQPLKGSPQPGNATYPLRSQDRLLLDLSGEWNAFSGLSGIHLPQPGTVGEKVYGVGFRVYNQGDLGKKAFVPGSWDYQVVTKQFFISNELSGRAFRLHILSSGGRAEVYINGTGAGELVGTVPGNNQPGYLDIATPRLKFGELNTVTIKIDSPKATGPWFPFPGISGEVYLEALGSIVLGNPEISTKLTPDGAGINLQMPINAKLVKGDVLTGQVNVIDAFGNTAATNTQNLTLGEDGKAVFNVNLNIPQAHLWNPADPYLYRVDVVVTSSGGQRDSYSLPLGIKEIVFSGNKLHLNGQEFVPKILQRVNDTQDSGAANNAVIAESDIKLAKQMGYNVLYIPDHTPQAYLYDLADRYGMLILGQLPVLGTPAQDSADTAAQARKMFSYHASFLAQGLGTALDVREAGVKDYINTAAKSGHVFYTVLGKPNLLQFDGGNQIQLSAPYLADYLNSQPSFKPGNSGEAQVNPVGILNRERSSKKEAQQGQPQQSLPPAVPFILGGIAVFLMLQSARLGNLRFIHLEGKLKRKIRGQARLQFYWFLLRICTVALLLAQTLSTLQSKGYFDFWLQFVDSYRTQVFIRYLMVKPWMLFAFVCGFTLIYNLLTAWLRVTGLPSKVAPMALILWLEKRKRWFVLALTAWLYTFYGGPVWLVGVALGLGILISAFALAKDIRRVGGKSYSMLLVTILGIITLFVAGLNWDLLKVLYHWYQLQGGKLWV